MSIWDQLAEQAHHLLTRPQRHNLTPAVTLVQSLHDQPPSSPAGICAHLDTASTVLPRLARYAHNGDRHALLMAAVLMRNPLRRIAAMADPDGYHCSDRDARDNDTLRIFFEICTTADPDKLTTRYLYGHTLKRVLKSRPAAGTPQAAYRLDPHSPTLDRADGEHTTNSISDLLQHARDRRVITDLEYDTLLALYLHADVFSPQAAAMVLGANVGAIERRAQRAIRKLSAHYEAAAA